MTAPLVSLLMPCFNAERFVGEALESVFAQTYPAIEVIVVDDGSTDNSRAMVERFRSRGLKLIVQANAGQSAAANRGLAEARGQLIKFMDADDLLATDIIERQVRALEGKSGAVAMGEWSRFIHHPSEATFPDLPMYRNANPIDWLADEFRGGEPMMQCAMFLIPASLLGRTGGWDERLTLINDFEFFTRVLLTASEIVYSPGARLYYRSQIPGSVSGRKSRDAAESAYLSLTTGTQHLLDAEDSPRTRLACANILRTFEYTFYPEHADLRRQLGERIVELGQGDLAPPGPPRFQALRRFIGWKAARRVQRMMRR